MAPYDKSRLISSDRRVAVDSSRSARRQLRTVGMLIALCVALAGGLFAVPAHAAPGDLDPSFGSDGRVLTHIGDRRFDEAQGVVVQPDGKIIAAGTLDNFAGGSFGVLRYNPDGSLDSSFGSGGGVSTFFANASATGEAIALQPDGKIVVVGGVSPFGLEAFDFALARYNPDGSLDAGFGAGGKVVTDLGGSFGETARAVAIQPDGKIVVVGASGSHAMVVRYRSSGRLDARFGDGGIVTIDFPGLQASLTPRLDLALQPDGKIIIMGQTLTTLARLKSDGRFDRGFGTGGKVPADSLPVIDSQAAAVALQSDGKIVLAGRAVTADSTTGSDFLLVRYNADGSLDVGFGSGGLVTTDFGLGDFVRDLIIQADGKIVAAGLALSERPGAPIGFERSSFALARYMPDGSLDDSFGAGGKVTTDFEGDVDANANALALQADGRIVAAGFAGLVISGGFGSFALTRYLDGAVEALAVAINIRPGTDKNPINPRSKGVIPVAILSTVAFDATSVDPLSVRFGPAGATAFKERGRFKDVDGDGDIDLVLRFHTQETGIVPDTTTACLTGQTFGGAQIQGCDAVRVRPRQGPHTRGD